MAGFAELAEKFDREGAGKKEWAELLDAAQTEDEADAAAAIVTGAAEEDADPEEDELWLFAEKRLIAATILLLGHGHVKPGYGIDGLASAISLNSAKVEGVGTGLDVLFEEVETGRRFDPEAARAAGEAGYWVEGPEEAVPDDPAIARYRDLRADIPDGTFDAVAMSAVANLRAIGAEIFDGDDEDADGDGDGDGSDGSDGAEG